MSACSTSCNKAKKKARESIPTSTTPRPSFYQRKLPDTCVAFASQEGKKIFKSALENNGLKSFYNLIEQHHTQTEPAFCGVSTLVLVLNALAVDPGQHWKGPWRWYEEKMLNCCVDLEEIKHAGITLRDFQCLAYCQGLSVDLQYCDETSSLEKFRMAVERSCLENTTTSDESKDEERESNNLECLVVSYSRQVLKQTGDGHFSPLAAYDKETDSVLILDTARFKYGAHWTKLPLIYEAMKPIDKTTGKSRGYAVLSFVHNKKMTTTAAESSGSTTLLSASSLSTQPASILYRSMMNQKKKRKRYKEYIQSLRDQNDQYRNGEDIPYDVVRSYWCDDKDLPSCVWEIIVPTRVRTEEEKEMLYKMRLLLAELHDAIVEKKSDNSRINAPTTDDESKGEALTTTSSRTYEPYDPKANHSSSVTAEETLYIIYLATLSAERRYDLVTNFESPGTSDVVWKQIIKEAEMVASAIEVSDQLTSL